MPFPSEKGYFPAMARHHVMIYLSSKKRMSRTYLLPRRSWGCTCTYTCVCVCISICRHMNILTHTYIHTCTVRVSDVYVYAEVYMISLSLLLCVFFSCRWLETDGLTCHRSRSNLEALWEELRDLELKLTWESPVTSVTFLRFDLWAVKEDPTAWYEWPLCVTALGPLRSLLHFQASGCQRWRGHALNTIEYLFLILAQSCTCSACSVLDFSFLTSGGMGSTLQSSV